MRLLVVDDHAIVRFGLKRLLAGYPEMVVAGEASCGEDALTLVRQSSWDLVLLDISMPRMGGIDTLKLLKECRPELPVLILSMHVESTHGVNAMRVGADGYLCKDCSAETLVFAIRKIASGQKYLSPELSDAIASGHYLQAETLKSLHTELSGREFQIFCKLAMGQSASTIANDLSLSIKTVSTYRGRILEKMGMKINAQMTYYAIKHGLIQ